MRLVEAFGLDHAVPLSIGARLKAGSKALSSSDGLRTDYVTTVARCCETQSRRSTFFTSVDAPLRSIASRTVSEQKVPGKRRSIGQFHHQSSSCSAFAGSPFSASGSTPRRRSSDRMIGVTVKPWRRIENSTTNPTMPQSLSASGTGM